MTSNGEFHHGHERIEELLALQVLGDLDEDEQTELERLRRQAGDCPECARLEREYYEAAAQLAYALPQAEVPEGAEARLLAAALGRQAEESDRVEPPDEPAPGTGRHAVPSRTRASGTRTHRVRDRILAGAAGVVLLVGGGVAGFAASQQRTPTPRATVTAAPDDLAAFLASPKTKLASFPRKSGQGTMSVAYKPSRSDAWVIANGLARPADSHVYQLWYAKPGSKHMQPSGTFVPGGSGTVTRQVQIGSDVGILAVTVEPHGGSQQPTTKPIAVQTV
ncbi:MAG: anti-sigma factor domain-containing protein [Streptosporangiales bacterium]